jgi:hypothetical protein
VDSVVVTAKLTHVRFEPTPKAQPQRASFYQVSRDLLARLYDAARA